jgi:hypothetical protein
MKKVLNILIIAAMLTACGNNDKKEMDTPKEIVADTTTNYNNSALTDTGTIAQTPIAPEETKKVTTTSHKSSTEVTKPAKVSKPASINQTAPSPATSTTTTTTQTEPVPVVEKKKGWNNATKDAVIGGGAGAIGGAILSKKKVKGAIIGGAVGAAGGYILGRNKDKKDTIR